MLVGQISTSRTVGSPGVTGWTRRRLEMLQPDQDVKVVGAGRDPQPQRDRTGELERLLGRCGSRYS
jgi:hypothetical protein